MNTVYIVLAVIAGIILLYVVGVYVRDFVARRIAGKQPKLSADEQRAADYAAYKAKM